MSELFVYKAIDLKHVRLSSGLGELGQCRNCCGCPLCPQPRRQRSISVSCISLLIEEFDNCFWRPVFCQLCMYLITLFLV